MDKKLITTNRRSYLPSVDNKENVDPIESWSLNEACGTSTIKNAFVVQPPMPMKPLQCTSNYKQSHDDQMQCILLTGRKPDCSEDTTPYSSFDACAYSSGVPSERIREVMPCASSEQTLEKFTFTYSGCTNSSTVVEERSTTIPSSFHDGITKTTTGYKEPSAVDWLTRADFRFDRYPKLSYFYSTESCDLIGCSQYVEDIISYLSDTEDEFELSYGFMGRSRAIKTPMRKIIVNWLIRLETHVKVELPTLYRCLAILDLFTDRELKLDVTDYQLAGIAALLIASKLEDENFITKVKISRLLYFTNYSYTRKQLLRMERRILTSLKFRLISPTPIQFLCYFFLRLGIVERKNYTLGYYAIDAVLIETQAAKAKPSMLAVSACYVTILANYDYSIRLETLDDPCYYREPDVLRLAYSITKCLLASTEPDNLSYAAYKKHRSVVERDFGDTSELERLLHKTLEVIKRRKVVTSLNAKR